MMIIGIDARTLAKVHTGIAVYTDSMIDWFQSIAPNNQYILISNKDFEMKENWKSCQKVLYHAKITGTIGVCYEIRKIIEDHHIDIFWGPEHCLPLTKGNYKKVVTIHDIAILLNPQWGKTYNNIIQKFIVPSSLNAADAVIAISNSTKNDIIKRFRICPDKVHVIYNGDSPYNYKRTEFSADEGEAIRNKFHIDDEYFLYCGTIEPRKNIQTIVKAFEQYKKTQESNKKLVLCGGLGWKYKPIIKTIENSPVYSEIVRTGYVTDQEKEYLYQHAEALIFPSYYEGFGLPILEAMSCGTPVITANNSSLPEAGGDIAYYVDDANDAASISIIMQQLDHLNLDQRLELSKKCIVHAKKFSRRTCATETLDLFNQLYAQIDI